MSDYLASYFAPDLDVFRASISSAYQDELNRLSTGDNHGEYQFWSREMPAITRETLLPYFETSLGMRKWDGQVVFDQVHDQLMRSIKIDKFVAGYEVNADDLREPSSTGLIQTHVLYAGELANAVMRHKNELVFDVLRNGVTLECFDGQNLFDTDHPSYDRFGKEKIVSNFITGSDPLFLMVNAGGVKPVLYQERESPKFYTNEQDQFDLALNGHIKYFVTAERAVTPFMWHGVQACKGALTMENLQLMWERMQSLHKKNGTPMMQMPTHIVVPPSLTFAAKRLLSRELIVESGAAIDNPWKGELQIMTSQWIAGA